MRAYKASDRSATGLRMLNNLRLSKAPDCPARCMSRSIEPSITFKSPFFYAMPVIPISLDNELYSFEHEIGLESPEHCLVHLELQSAFLEFIAEGLF